MSPRLLYSELQESNKYLAQVFDSIFAESLKIWDEQYLRQFTVHGRQHTAQVERNLDSITLPLQNSREKLTAEEIFILLSACCLHDIGMQLVDDPEARNKHAQYAYELILYSHAQVGPEQRRVTLPIDDPNARAAIASIARAHWTDHALALISEDYIVGVERGRLRLLGVLLAMADLLDISPVRARYYRSVHRLYELAPLSELHQKMHDLVKGFQIVSPKRGISGDLQFQLEWRDDSETVRKLNDWILRWFDSQWRRLEPVLYEESGGTIRWVKPQWATIKFRPAEGPVPDLSTEALNILLAEMTEQQRIDRDEFVRSFQDSIKLDESKLFVFPKSSEYDGRMLSEWCEARARLYENCLVARVDILPSAALDLSSIIAEIMEQWGEHIPSCSNAEALTRLERFVSTNLDHRLISVIISEDYEDQILTPLLSILFRAAGTGRVRARVSLLLSNVAIGPESLEMAEVSVFNAQPFTQSEIERHLQSRLGYNVLDSREIYLKLSGIGFAEKPGQVYSYLETHCGISWVNGLY
jgi:hypothetical protein